MEQILYNIDSVLIVTVLFIALVVAMELGLWLGRMVQTTTVDLTKSQINAIQASMLALLALILGFTFSLALQRHDNRATAIVDEANAIGTTYLRADLLPASVRAESKQLLREYIDYRVRAGTVSLDQANRRQSVMMKSDSRVIDLWHLTAQAAAEDGGPVTSGLFIQSLNETIDLYGLRDAIINRHVPEIVILLLFATFVLTGLVIGYASGVEDHRPSAAAYALALLIVLLVFIIIDLDRPRRGLIQIPQDSLIGVQEYVLADSPDKQ